MEEPGRLQFTGSLESDTTERLCFHALEKEMATHSSVLAWRIPGTGSLVGCRLWGRTESDTTLTDHFTCLLINLYAGQEATVRTLHGTTDWFQIGKEIQQGCVLSPYLFNFYAKYIM